MLLIFLCFMKKSILSERTETSNWFLKAFQLYYDLEQTFKIFIYN